MKVGLLFMKSIFKDNFRKKVFLATIKFCGKFHA